MSSEELEKVVCVAVVRDHDRYRMCFDENPHVEKCERVLLDNCAENLPIPVRYNAFLNRYDYSKLAWFVFAHEDFEIRDDLAKKLNGCDKNSLWSPIGCYRQSVFGIGRQRYVGTIYDANRKTGVGLILQGRPVKKGTKVETFDCCCLIVHSSLVQKCNLRFDERLSFDLYVEDFCASAWVNHGVSSRILPFESVHYSLSVPQDRYYRHLPYLRSKYPHNCFVGTCSYFGTMPLMMRIQRWLMGRANDDRLKGLY